MSKETEADGKNLDACRNETYLEITLRQDKNFRSCYNIILSALCCLVIRNALNDYSYDGGSQYGFKRLLELIYGYETLIFFILAIYTTHSLIFIYWKLRIKFKGTSLLLNLGWNHLFPCYVCLHFLLFNVFGYFCIKYNISILWRIYVLFSFIFLTLKGYAFLRTNMEYLHEKGKKYIPPKFSHYLYFTFAPTLIYKDVFIRSTRGRSWRRLLFYSFEIFVHIYLLLLVDSLYSENIRNFGKERFRILDVFYQMIASLPLCFLFGVLAFNIVITETTKFMAELMCFGERNFSTDWWTSTNITIFYIKSNIYIQNFIYKYAYKEFDNKYAARVIIFLISTLVHDLTIFYCCEITLPVFIIGMFYMITQGYYPKTGYVYNFLILFQVYGGIGFVVCGLRMEYFAKQNCPNTPESLIYFPRLFSCEVNN